MRGDHRQIHSDCQLVEERLDEITLDAASFGRLELSLLAVAVTLSSLLQHVANWPRTVWSLFAVPEENQSFPLCC